MKPIQRGRGIASKDAMGSVYNMQQPGFSQHPVLRRHSRQAAEQQHGQHGRHAVRTATEDRLHTNVADGCAISMYRSDKFLLCQARGLDQKWAVPEYHEYPDWSARDGLRSSNSDPGKLGRCEADATLSSRAPSNVRIRISSGAPVRASDPPGAVLDCRPSEAPRFDASRFKCMVVQGTGKFHKTDSDDEADARGGSCQDLSVQLSDLESQLIDIERKFRTAETERQELHRGQAASRIRCEELVGQLEDADEQTCAFRCIAASAEEREAALRTELGTSHSSTGALRTRLGVSEEEAQLLREKLDASEAHEKEAADENERLARHADELRAQLGTLEGAVQGTERSLELARQELALERGRAEHTTEQWAASEAECQSLAENLLRVTAGFENARVRDVHEAEEAAAAQVEEAERARSAARLDTLTAQRSHLEEELAAEREAHVSTSRASTAAAVAAADAAAKAAADHRKALEALEAELDAQRQEAASARRQAERWELSADRSRRELEELRAEAEPSVAGAAAAPEETSKPPAAARGASDAAAARLETPHLAVAAVHSDAPQSEPAAKPLDEPQSGAAAAFLDASQSRASATQLDGSQSVSAQLDEGFESEGSSEDSDDAAAAHLLASGDGEGLPDSPVAAAAHSEDDPEDSYQTDDACLDASEDQDGLQDSS